MSHHEGCGGPCQLPAVPVGVQPEPAEEPEIECCGVCENECDCFADHSQCCTCDEDPDDPDCWVHPAVPVVHPEPGDRAEDARMAALRAVHCVVQDDGPLSLLQVSMVDAGLEAAVPIAVAAAVAAVRADREEEPLLAKLERWRSEDPGWWATYDEARATTWRGSTVVDEPYASIHAERSRAHAKHGDTSMEGLAVDDPIRLAVLTEEVGEVARELNEGRHAGEVDRSLLRAELIQVGAMAAAWAAALDGRPLS